ncbi:MAG: MFS transporter [Halobacteriales archaeon]|nr:MFS transporter [Halobacteriales archaeon]
MNRQVEETGEQLFSGYSGRILLLVTGGELIISLGGLILPPLLPTIIGDLGITPSQAGAVMTVWWLSVAVNNFPGGRLADRLSQKTVILAGLAVSILGLLVLSSAVTYLLLLVGVAILGIGRGLFQPAAIVQISNVFVARRGQALGIRNAAFTAGGTIAGGAAIVILAIADWRAAFLPIVVGLGVVSVLMHVWNRQPYEVRWVELDIRETARRLLRIGEIRWIVVALSLYGFAWNGATSFLPTYLQVDKGFAPAAASVAFSALFLIGALAQPASGFLGDRFGQLRAAATATTTCALGLFVLIIGTTRPVELIGLVVFAAGLAAFWPVMTAHGMNTLPDESRGGDWGAVTATFLVAESLGSTFVGVVVERASYDLAYSALLGCFLGTAAITIWLARKA